MGTSDSPIKHLPALEDAQRMAWMAHLTPRTAVGAMQQKAAEEQQKQQAEQQRRETEAAEAAGRCAQYSPVQL